MKKVLGDKLPIPSRVLARWPDWPLPLQLLAFWLMVIAGAAVWAAGLWLVAGRPPAERIPMPWQTAYLIGLYAWLLWLCRQARLALTLPPLPVWRPAWQWVAGAGIALLSLGLLLALSLALGWAKLQAPRSDWPLIALQVLVMAIAIATIEEIVFRGLMLNLALRRLTSWQALNLQALIYASLHLLRGDLTPLSWGNALLSLWLTGLLLGQLRLHSGSLAISTGLHGAWIASTSFGAWAALLHWQPAWGAWSGKGNPVYGLSGLMLLVILNLLSARALKQRVTAVEGAKQGLSEGP